MNIKQLADAGRLVNEYEALKSYKQVDHAVLRNSEDNSLQSGLSTYHFHEFNHHLKDCVVKTLEQIKAELADLGVELL